MDTLPLRLAPGVDLRRTLEDASQSAGWAAGHVLGGIGNLAQTRLRLAGAADATVVEGPTQILTLAGTLAAADRNRRTLRSGEGRRRPC